MRLVGALHGRLVVANQSPVAAISRLDAARVRGLVAGARDGLPAAPWPAAPRRGSAGWPDDSASAYAAVLAHEWLVAHDPGGTVARAGRRGSAVVAVALYQGPPVVTLSAGGGVGAEHAPDVRDQIARRLPPRALAMPRVVATIPYRLTVLVAGPTDAPGASAGPALLEHVAPAALRAGRALGSETAGAAWFSGRILVPDPAIVAAMDTPSRQRWAQYTGRAGAGDSYWYPESWARFLEPGRKLGIVSAATVGQSMPGGRTPGAATRAAPLGSALGAALGAALGPAVERGVCVPPGYALVDCVGTLGTAVVVG